MADNNPVLDVAAAVADGAVVDWQLAADSAATDEDRHLLAELRFISELAQNRLATVSHSSSASPILDTTFKTWGPLRIIDRVGGGTFGEVFRAWDSRLDREVALKILRRRQSDDADRASTVIEEGRLLARVRHPNVVTVYGAERLDGQVGVWMEFVRGKTLEEDLRSRGTLDVDQLLTIGIQLSDALAAVHRAGLVHRDVKAQNVIRDDEGRLVLMSGTPHQGSEARFKNILRLLSDDGKSMGGAAGRVIFRTKDRVRDWRGAPLFPSREIRQPVVVGLGQRYEQWYLQIGSLYDMVGSNGVRSRAAGWAKGQALQWAASSVQAGLGFLVRLSLRRLNWTLGNPPLTRALASLRPYRGGRKDEPLQSLYERIVKQVGSHALSVVEAEDDDDAWEEDEWRPDADALAELIEEGVKLISSGAAQAKWEAVCKVIDAADGEKIVLFAQPVETVTVVADILEQRYGQRPAIIIGNQSDDQRRAEVDHFQADDGARFLVSSRAGGEGLNMQRARRLIHLDVPWNPMELEQRIGRIHRFGSRKTVLIDTVVAAGSREVDMYRIAREKLAMIAKHLDPEQFETLFSRVMSLVPPKELEGILGNISGSSEFDGPATLEIGRLVTEGYRSWSSFDETYRKEADDIRAVNPGEARWADVGAFLVKYGGAEDSDGASFSSFEFQDNEIVSVDERVPTISFDKKLYACGDTGGLRAVDGEGTAAISLGLSLDEVQQVLRSCFTPERPTGSAFIKRPAGLDFLGPANGSALVLAFIRQTLHQERGRWEEKSISLRMFVVPAEGEPQELRSRQQAELVRAVQAVPRVKEPSGVLARGDLQDVEHDLLWSLRRPSDAEIAGGVRHAVWPIAALVLNP